MATLLSATDKTANISLSGSDLTMSLTDNSVGAVRATTGKSSLAGGKYYFEVIIGQQTYVNYVITVGVGISGTSHALTQSPGAASPGTGYKSVYSFGQWAYDLSDAAEAASGQSPVVTGDALGVLVDFDNLVLKTKRNGGAIITGSPISAATFFPHFLVNRTGDGLSVNFGGTSFAYPVPDGYVPWDSPPVAQRTRLVQNNRPIHFIGL